MSIIKVTLTADKPVDRYNGTLQAFVDAVNESDCDITIRVSEGRAMFTKVDTSRKRQADEFAELERRITELEAGSNV